MRTIQAILFLLLVPVLAAAQSWERISDISWDGKITTLRTDPVTMFIGNMRSSDGGRTWHNVTIDSSRQFDFVLAVHPIFDSLIYVRASELNPVKHVVLQSNDAGTTFALTAAPGNLKQLYISPINPDLHFGFKFPYASIQETIGMQPMSFDGGVTWNDTVYHKLTDDNESELSKSATMHWFEESLLFDIHPTKPDTYLRVHYTHYWNSIGVEWAYELTRRSVNGIFNDWIDVKAWPEYLHYAQELIHSPTGDTLFHRTKSSLWISADMGDTWEMIYRDDSCITSSVVYEPYHNSILLGMDTEGILWLENFNSTWQYTNTGLRSTNIRDLHTDHNGNIYALTDEGLYLFSHTPVGINNDPASTPEAFALHAPYPNPGSGEVQLTFELRRAANTELLLYDTYGRCVLTLVNDYLPSGYRGNYQLDTSALTEGLYFIRLRADGYVVTRKITVVH